MISDEYTDDKINQVTMEKSYFFKHPFGHSPMPIIKRISSAKYKDANWMP